MLKFLKWFLGLFSPYVHPFERKVDKFFGKINSRTSLSSIRRKLLKLMQKDLVVTNVWLEKKFKGYRYLDKSTRRKMYEDTQAIVSTFNEFCKKHVYSEKQARELMSQKGLTFPNGAVEQTLYLMQIMAFLRPGQFYRYIKTASFGKLLRDPRKQKLEGDCNQIVTLYIYLFSLKFPLDQLQIKLLPEHVCLHFRNVDIEATNGTFQKYSEKDQILPVTEIISTNLLDLSDFRESVQSISPRTMVKSAQLAYAISSLKSLVQKNLDITYHNFGVAAMKSKDFKTAIYYFSLTSDKKELSNAYRNASIYYLKAHDFKKARYYASKVGDRDLEKTIKHNEGIYYYQADKISKALQIFRSLNDREMEKACYAKQYNELAKKVSSVKSLADAKRHRSTYRKMLTLAQKMGDSSLASGVRETLGKI